MTRLINQSLPVVALLLCTYMGMAQSVSSVNAQITGESLQIIYQVRGLQVGQRFTVQLYSSSDNYAEPITNGVAGAIGEDLSLTQQNIISMPDPIGTLGFITSDISFRVIATMTYNPVSIRYPTEPFKIKRGKELEISWYGGLENEQVTFQLYRNGTLSNPDFYTTQNKQSATVRIPKLEKGGRYTLQFSMPSEPKTMETGEFYVKKKTGWIALVVLAVGGVIVGDLLSEDFNVIPGEPFTPKPIPNPLPLPEGPPSAGRILNKLN